MLTLEQQEVVDAVCSANNNSGIIAVNAVAGSGKTSTANAVIQAYKPKNGFYTAFNKAIVQDSAKRFGNMLDCRTMHSLAYQYIRPSKQIRDLTYADITEDLDYKDKSMIISTLDDFYRSKSTDIEEYVTATVNSTDIQDLVIQYANKMLNGEVNPTFSYLLKCLHLLMLNGEVTLNYDLLILDESQDAVGAFLEIFKLANAKAKLILGDKFQNIYSFMNTVNAFEELEDIELHKLTKSFRCNPEVASVVEDFGRQYLDEDFQFIGNEDIESATEVDKAYISRTNAILISRMYLLRKDNTLFDLIRSPKEIFALPIALLNASLGKEVYDSKYKYLQTEYQNYMAFPDPKPYANYFGYLYDILPNDNIANTIDTLRQFRQAGINLYDLKKYATDTEKDNHIILTTAHAFKGLEKDTVFIENDLNRSVKVAYKVMNDAREYMIKNDMPVSLNTLRNCLSVESKENLNTYYVALSRAKTVLNNVFFPVFY